MKEPRNVTEVRHFLGVANQLSKFTPDLACKQNKTVASKKNCWVWSDHQQRAFEDIKHELSAQPVMALYDLHSETVVFANASAYGLGAVLIQRQRDGNTGNCRPVAYVSRAMTNTEQMYA